MTKFFQLVAIGLVATVLSGTQCIEFCSLLSADRSVQATPTPVDEMPCHQQEDSRDSSPPASGHSCSHPEWIAEERTEASPAFDFHTVSLAPLAIEAQLVPVLSATPFSVTCQKVPGQSPLVLSSVLRV